MEIYLTLDDGPIRTSLQRAELLNKHNIPATFFIVGKNIQKNPEIAKELVNRGFILGNHSYSHTDFSKLSTQEIKEEIDRTDELIQEIYQKTGVEQPTKLFRYPWGNKGVGHKHLAWYKTMNKFKEIDKHLKQNNYQNPLQNEFQNLPWLPKQLNTDTDIFVTHNCRDYHFNPTKEVYKNTAAKLEKILLTTLGKNSIDAQINELNKLNGKNILVLHDHDSKNEHFGLYVNKLIELGAQFSSLDDQYTHKAA